jgi:hypothetical protein
VVLRPGDEEDAVAALLASLASGGDAPAAAPELTWEVAALLAQACQEGLLVDPDDDAFTPSDDEASLEDEELSRADEEEED